MNEIDRDLALTQGLQALVAVIATQRRIIAAVRHLSPPLGYAASTRGAIEHLDAGIEEIERAEAATLAAMSAMGAVDEGDEEAVERMVDEGGPCDPSETR